jgi:hypothetical protein
MFRGAGHDMSVFSNADFTNASVTCADWIEQLRRQKNVVFDWDRWEIVPHAHEILEWMEGYNWYFRPRVRGDSNSSGVPLRK